MDMIARFHRSVLCTGLVFVAATRAPAQAVRLSAKPILVIGAEDRGNAYQFDRVTGALRLENGSIVVGNSATAELRLFDNTGMYIKSASRAGAGPGEFELGYAIRPFGFGSTAVIAGAGSLARVNRYNASGTVLPQIVLRSQPQATVMVVEGTDRGAIVARTTANAILNGAPGQRISTLYRYAVYDSTGAQQVALFELPTAERIVHSYQSRTRFPYLPFSPNPVVAVGANRVLLIRAGAPQIEMWALNGKPAGVISWNAPRSRVRDVWARWRAAELATISRPFDQAFYGDFWSDRLPLPEYVPVAEQMHVDPQDRIWVVRARLPWESAGQCDVLDLSGRLLARLTLPPRLTVLHVGKDYLLGKERTEDDIELIALYRIESARAAR
jgi:hypothetical protein